LANDTLSKLNFIHKPLRKLTRDVANGLLSQICRFVRNERAGPVLRGTPCINPDEETEEDTVLPRQVAARTVL
jgi:hypothetical protein